MSNLTEDVMDNFTAGETPDVATKDIFYSIARDAIVFKEGNEDIIYMCEDQEGIDDQVLICIKTEDEEQEVQVHLVGEQEAVNFEDLDTRLIKHEENDVVLENILDEPQEEEEGVEYKYVLQESIDAPSKDQLLNYIKAEDEDCQDDFMGEVKVEESTGLIMYEGDEVPPEYTKDEPKVEHESIAVPQTEDTTGRKDTLDVFLNEFEITSELSTHLTSVKSSGSEETGGIIFNCSDKVQMDTAWTAVDTEDEKEEEEALKCSVCGLFCPSYDFLKKHMTSHAAGNFCPFICKQAIELSRHLKNMQPIPHVKTHFNVTRSGFQCLFCSYHCMLALNFKRHLEIHLKERSKKSCPQSVHPCRSIPDIEFNCIDNTHMEMDVDIVEKEDLKCNLCGLRFETKNPLQNHVSLHREGNLFKCLICPFLCKQAMKLRRHMDGTHPRLKPYECNNCPFSSRNASSLKRHAHCSTKKTPLQCSICSYKCTLKQDFQKHLATHLKAFKCPQCLQCFRSNRVLLKHLKHSHPDVRPPKQCTLCPFAFYYISELNAHVKQAHPEVKPYKCSKCPFASTNASSLRYHIKVSGKHSKEKK